MVISIRAMKTHIVPVLRTLGLCTTVMLAACGSSSSGSNGKLDAQIPVVALDAAVPGPDAAPATADARGDAQPDFGPLPTGAGPVVYVGGFRPEIDIFRLDMATAKMTQVAVVPDPPESPSYMAFASSGKFVYTVDEVDAGKVVAFSIDQATGMLNRLNDAPAYGVGPTYIKLDKTGKWALTASWAGDEPASISVVPINAADGKVGMMPVDSRVFSVNGHAHYITTDPTNKFVFASINGEKYIAQYKFDDTTGKLTENTPFKAVRTPMPGDPRHNDFHPNGKFFYSINESGGTVTVFSFDSTTGLLTQIQDIPTLPAGYSGPANSTAQILVHKSGKFVYGSNRGHNSIVIYSVDQTTGMLTFVAHQTAGVGGRPRNFNMDPTGTLLLLASQDDGTVTIFKIDQDKGTLTQAGPAVPAGVKPTFVWVLPLP
jgi:6-phosphogluconolactonase